MNEALRAKLARLRREEPLAREAPSALPAWFTARRATPLAAGEVAGDTPSTGGARSLEPPLDLVEHAGPRGVCAARTRSYPGDHLHGEWRLDEVHGAAVGEFAWIARDPALERLAPESAVYLDIETTGLAGGAGTIPFLMALGGFRDGRFQLWQAFLRDPSEEPAALALVAERIASASGVVSFFGKSFDRHRLEDKMRLHRIAPPFAGKPHLDLYHPLARLYRGAFADSRLATFERELCGVLREGDLPGSLAPGAWFDFLSGQPHRLEAVFRHNEQDVLSLVALAAHLARSRAEARAGGAALSGCGRARARAVAELHAARGEHALALEWLERALARPGSDEGALWFRHAECLRKLGARERARRRGAHPDRSRARALAVFEQGAGRALS